MDLPGQRVARVGGLGDRGLEAGDAVFPARQPLAIDQHHFRV
jgi:hypothetical protein